MCSSHIGTRALLGKAFRTGFYWPSTIADAHKVVRTCPNYQWHTPYIKFPPDEVQLLPPVWPLACWGIDIVGPLPTAPGNYKYAVVAVEYSPNGSKPRRSGTPQLEPSKSSSGKISCVASTSPERSPWTMTNNLTAQLSDSSALNWEQIYVSLWCITHSPMGQ